MHVGLTDVFVRGIIGDEFDVVVAVELCVEGLIIVGDGG